MLSGAGLGQEFWALVVDSACYLKNRSPTSSLVDKTPYEVWSGQKPSIPHLKVFGCEAFVSTSKCHRHFGRCSLKVKTLQGF